jgi:hypothetical protein
MSSFAWREGLFFGGMMFGFLAAAMASAAAQQRPVPPDFSSHETGWIGMNGAGPFFEAVPGRLAPVSNDPAHPFVPNGTGKQPTFRIADLSNPNLMPWVKERMKKDNDEVLAGKTAFTAQSSCLPTGVPLFMGLGGPYPVIFRQTPKEVWMIFTEDNQVRRIYMDVPHSANPKPSWYGESVGHYEGDTLVIDTIGQNTKSFIDNYRTPHSERLHVVERYRLIEDGKTLEANVVIEDPVALKQPLHVIHRWRKVAGPITESRCADGESFNPFEQRVEKVPTADRADF